MPRRGTQQPEVRILCGPVRSDRHARMLERLRANWGRAVLLVPSNRLASQRLEDVLLSADLPGTWGKPVDTFQSFVMRILQDEDIDTRLLDEFERHAILEHVVQELRAGGNLGPLSDAADTPGFIHHIMRVVTQLKQAAVEPADFRVRIMEHGRSHWLDAVVAEVYEGYQAELIERGRYDLVGLYWRAELVCREKRPPLFEHIRHLVLDGFDDFTSSEFRLVETIAPHLESLAFSMSCSLAPSQQDLYATPRSTIDRIQRAFHSQIDESDEFAPDRLSHYVGANLFYRDPPSPRPAGLRDDITLAVHANPVQEFEGVARAAKCLILDEGVAPSDVAVILRDPADHADILRAVFHEFGVPATIEARPSLAQSAIGRFVLALLDVAPAWRRDAVLDVMASPWFAPLTDALKAVITCRTLFPTIARIAQIIEGREDWTAKLQRLVTRFTHDHGREMTGLRMRYPEIEFAAHALHESLELLTNAVIPMAASSNEYDLVQGLRHALNLLEVERAVTSDDDRAAWDVLMGVFDSVQTWTEGTTRERRYADSANRIRHALAVASYAVTQPRDGVRILSFESARHVSFQHVFAAGLVSGVVPQPPAASAIYTDADIAELESAGIVLESKRGRNARERLLFHHALNLPRERLHLSWHARSREDKEVGPSPFVADVRELTGIETRVRDFRTRVVPPLHEAMNLRDLRNAAAAVDAHIPEFEPVLARARAAAAIERRRYQSVPFDSHDGIIANDALLDALRARFGPDHHFSARQLETYARCPFRFLAQEIFGIEQPEDPAPELDSRLRGTIMHDALQRFHTQFRDMPVSSIDRSQADDAMRAAVSAAFDAWASRDIATPPGVRVAESARMTQHLLRYLELERAQDGDWRPAHFEVSFGNAPRDSHDAWSRPEPFALDTAAGPILISGKIDRVDETGDALRVIDYKTSLSQYTARTIEDGVEIQLLLYVHALEDAIAPGRSCANAQYLWVGRKKIQEALGKTAGQRRETMLEKIAQYVDGIRSGVFSPSPYLDSCTYCEMRRVCRYEEGRIARKIDA